MLYDRVTQNFQASLFYYICFAAIILLSKLFGIKVLEK